MTTQTHLPGSGASGAAQSMVNVFATLPNGAPGDMIQTDASGQGTLKAYPGGAVTAIYRHTADMGADLVTFMGVKPGDALKFGRDFTGTPQSLGTMTLSWPAMANAYYYAVYTPCGNYFAYAPTVQVTISESDTCDHIPMDIVVVAYNTSFQVQGFSYSLVNFTNGGSQGVNGFSTPGTANANATGLPSDITYTSASFYNVFAGGSIGHSAGSSSTMVTGGAATMSFPWRGMGARTYAELYMQRSGSFRQIRVEDSFSSGTTSWTIANPQLPPWLGSTMVSSLALRVVNWFQYGPATHDGTIVTFSWNHVINATNNSFTWSFVVPPDTQAIKMPTLPAAFADLGPHPEDTGGFAQVRLIEIPTVSGYDAFRAIPERQLFCIECAVRANTFQRAIVAN